MINSKKNESELFYEKLKEFLIERELYLFSVQSALRIMPINEMNEQGWGVGELFTASIVFEDLEKALEYAENEENI